MLKKLSPRQKQIAVAVAGAAVLALIALLGRRNGGAQGQATDPASGGAPPFGSTFADNGEAAAGLSSAITEGLGDVAIGLESVGSSQQTINETLAELVAQRDADSAAVQQTLGAAVVPTPAVAPVGVKASINSRLRARPSMTRLTPRPLASGDKGFRGGMKPTKPKKTTAKPKPKRPPKTKARPTARPTARAAAALPSSRPAGQPTFSSAASLSSAAAVKTSNTSAAIAKKAIGSAAKRP